jgi:hypothetical protein
MSNHTEESALTAIWVCGLGWLVSDSGAILTGAGSTAETVPCHVENSNEHPLEFRVAVGIDLAANGYFFELGL